MGLCRKGFCPKQRQVKVGTPVVDAAKASCRAFVFVEEPDCGVVQCVGQHLRLRIVRTRGDVLEAWHQGHELAKAVPAQVVFADELLHVLGGRASRAGLKQATAIHQGHDAQHFGRGAHLKDGEEVCQVVTQHIARHRNGVQAFHDAFQGEGGRFGGGEDVQFQPIRIVLRQVRLHLGDELGVVGAVGIEPEHGRIAGGACTGHGQLHPVLDGGVFDLAHAEHIPFGNVLVHQHVTACGDDFHTASGRHLESLVVGAVFLGFLGHEPDVGHTAHGGGIQCAVGLTEIDGRLVHPGVGAVGNDGDSILRGPLGVPHLAAFADHGRHGRVDDDI